MLFRFVIAACAAAVVLLGLDRLEPKLPGLAVLDNFGQVPSPLGNSGHLTATLDRSGRIHLVWVQFHPASHSWLLQHSRQTDDFRGWTVPATINEPTTSAFSPDIAFDENGNAALIWVQFARGSNLVFSREMSSAGVLGPVVQVDRDRGDQSHRFYSGAYDPHVAYDRSTRTWHAIWSQWDGWADRIFVNERAAASTWGPSSIIDAGRTDSYAPSMCFNDRGDALAVWYQLDWRLGHTATRPFVAAHPRNHSWQPAQDISADAGDGSWTRMMCDADRGYYLVWHQSDAATGYRLWGSYVGADGAMASDRILLESQGFRRTIVSGAEMERGSDGKAHVVWCGETNGRQMLYAAVWDGSAMAAPLVDAMPLQAGTCLHPAIAISGTGRRVVTWTEEDDTAVHIRQIGIEPEPHELLQRVVRSLEVFGPAYAQPAGPAADTVISLAKDTGAMHPSDKPVPPRFTKHVKVKSLTDGRGQVWAFWVGLGAAGRHSLYASRFGG